MRLRSVITREWVLLPNDKRNAGNQRIYDEADGERLRFILHCRNHKIAIQDIRLLLAIRDGTQEDMQAVRKLKLHIDELRRQRDSLDGLIRSLSTILEGIDGNPAEDAEIISVLSSVCPHCPDYEKKVREGKRIDERAKFLAPPLKKGTVGDFSA